MGGEIENNKKMQRLNAYFCLIDIADQFRKNCQVEDEQNIDNSDILLWAIFSNRKELAEIFWLRTNNQLCKFFLKVFKQHIYVIPSLFLAN